MKRSMLLTMVIAIAALATTASAQFNLAQPISYQGYLVGDTGAVTGSYQIQFSIWDDSTGGTQLWTETHPSVPVNFGLFSLMLGSIVAIPVDSYLVGPEVYLEVQIGADSPIYPRSLLGSVPTAGIAQRVIGDIYTKPGMLSIYKLDDTIPVIEMTAESTKTVVSLQYDTSDADLVALIELAADSEGPDLVLQYDIGDADLSALIELAADSEGPSLMLRDSMPDKVGKISFQSGTNRSDIDLVWKDLDDYVKVSLGVESTGGSLTIGDSLRDHVILNQNGLVFVNAGDAVGRAIDQSVYFADTFGDTLAYLSPSGVYTSGPVRSGNSLVLNGPADQLETTSGEMYLGREEGTGAFSDVMISIGHKTPTEMLDVAGTVKMDGFKLPGGSNGYVLTSDAGGIGTWQAGGGGGNDNDWYLGTTNNDVLFSFGRWGIAREGNTLHGSGDSTHVNLGRENTTGASGQNNIDITVSGGRQNTARGQYSTIGGGVSNDVWVGTFGGIIGGGNANDVKGTYGTISGGQINSADYYSSVGGGLSNTASGEFSVVGGGRQDTASGIYSIVSGGVRNTASGDSSTVGGGAFNLASGDLSVVAGGYQGVASSSYSTVGGGTLNLASGYASVAAGGSQGVASGAFSIVSGGSLNLATGQHATVSGGTENVASGFWSVVAGGVSNVASAPEASVGGGLFDTSKAIYGGVFSGFSNLAGDNLNDSAAFIGGGYNNSATAKFALVSGGKNNNVTGTYSTIGGGSYNTAAVSHTVVSGGNGNTASNSGAVVGGGMYNDALGWRSTVSGGDSCQALSDHATVSGGYTNIASDIASTVGGGASNVASGPHSTIGGGEGNVASASISTIGGGWMNQASAHGATVAGGDSCIASGNRSAIGGGLDNTASGWTSTIGGGSHNRARGNYSVVAGGGGPNKLDSNLALGLQSTISGGIGNRATNSYSVIGGGVRNSASSPVTTVAGGWENTASGQNSTIGGGAYNTAAGFSSTISGGENNWTREMRATVGGGYMNTADSEYTVVAGGYKNRALSTYSSVGGGDQDSALGFYSTVPGGSLNRAWGDYSFAAGRRAKADHSGSFVWGDATNADFVSTGNNQFLIRASGGVGINNNSPGYDLDVTGTIGGSGGLYHSSDIRWKRNISAIVGALDRVSRLRGVNFEWRRQEYPEQNFTEGNQIGFIAQEVSEVLPEVVMQRKDGFYSVDYAKLTPILVEAIKEQQRTIESQERELSVLHDETTNLESRFAELKALVQTLIDEKSRDNGQADLASNK